MCALELLSSFYTEKTATMKKFLLIFAAFTVLITGQLQAQTRAPIPAPPSKSTLGIAKTNSPFDRATAKTDPWHKCPLITDYAVKNSVDKTTLAPGGKANLTIEITRPKGEIPEACLWYPELLVTSMPDWVVGKVVDCRAPGWPKGGQCPVAGGNATNPPAIGSPFNNGGFWVPIHHAEKLVYTIELSSPGNPQYAPTYYISKQSFNTNTQKILSNEIDPIYSADTNLSNNKDLIYFDIPPDWLGKIELQGKLFSEGFGSTTNHQSYRINNLTSILETKLKKILAVGSKYDLTVFFSRSGAGSFSPSYESILFQGTNFGGASHKKIATGVYNITGSTKVASNINSVDELLYWTEQNNDDFYKNMKIIIKDNISGETLYTETVDFTDTVNKFSIGASVDANDINKFTWESSTKTLYVKPELTFKKTTNGSTNAYLTTNHLNANCTYIGNASGEGGSYDLSTAAFSTQIKSLLSTGTVNQELKVYPTIAIAAKLPVTSTNNPFTQCAFYITSSYHSGTACKEVSASSGCIASVHEFSTDGLNPNPDNNLTSLDNAGLSTIKF